MQTPNISQDDMISLSVFNLSDMGLHANNVNIVKRNLNQRFVPLNTRDYHSLLFEY